MARMKQIKKNLRHREWAEEIAECRSSGMQIKEWCRKNGIRANIVKAENQTPACIIAKGLPDASLVADIMQKKYQLGEPLYRQEQYWKLRGIYNRFACYSL